MIFFEVLLRRRAKIREACAEGTAQDTGLAKFSQQWPSAASNMLSESTPTILIL